jgi:hypothetical protein
LGQDVIDSFPVERDKTEQRTRDVQKKWVMLENKTRERSKRLEDVVGMQVFPMFKQLRFFGTNVQRLVMRSELIKMTEKINSRGQKRKAVLRGWHEKGDLLRQVSCSTGRQTSWMRPPLPRPIC